MRRAFTLLELLVATSIILILAGLVMGALHGAREAARRERTAKTIAKLDAIIRVVRGEYEIRRIPVGPDDAGANALDASGRFSPLLYRRWLDNCRRDLMRIEMPDRWCDVTEPPLFLPEANGERYARLETFRRLYAAAVSRSGQAAVDTYESCECLYLVATTGKPDARGMFMNIDIGDADGDGLHEFIDGWGNPIGWHRWPAGWALRPDAEWVQTEPASSNPTFETFGPYPLIFSAGPDGICDINRGVEPDGANGWQTYRYGIDVYGNLNPWCDDENTPPHKIGEPLDAVDLSGNPPNGSLDHYDNITNYSMAP